MMKFQRIFFSVFISVSTLLMSCSSENLNPGAGYNREAMLEHQADAIIIPDYENLVAAMHHLPSSAALFVANPSSQTLTALQDTFRLSFLAWKRAEFFYIGPAETTMLAKQIDSWPTNMTVIENEISGSHQITDAYIAATGTTRKGFPALEYLIFPYQSRNEATILASFTTDPNADRRKQYLVSLCNVIDAQVNACLNAWKPGDGNYRAEFIALNGTDVAGSATQMMNSIIQNLEVIINYKIGIPLGKMSGGTVLPEKAESFRAGLSQMAIEENILVLEKLYSGDGGPGFDDYLDFVQAEYEPGVLLSQKIAQQFDSCYIQAQQLTGPVHELVVSDPAALDQLYLSLKQLLVLLKSDMSSRLGLLITFSDNDGD